MVHPVPTPFWIPLLISWRGKEKIFDNGCGCCAAVVVVDDGVLVVISLSLQLSSLLNDCCWSKVISFRAFSMSYASSKRYSMDAG